MPEKQDSGSISPFNSRTSAGRGVDVLLKKASVDAAFKKLLLAHRSRAAVAIGLELDPAEAALIDETPRSQLAAVIARTTVPLKIRPVFLGYAAGVMLAALGASTACDAPVATFGSQPDPPPERPDVTEPTPSLDAQGAAAIGEDGPDMDRETER